MITIYTEDQLTASALAYFRVSFANSSTPVDLSDRSFLGLLARAFARFFVLMQSQVMQANNDAIPAYQQDADGNLRSKTSRAALEQWAFVFGLPSDVAGVYGARGATIATGGAGLPTATAPAVLIPAGTQARDGTSQITVETTAAVTTDGPPNTQPVQFVSVTKGTKANLSTGSILTWISPPIGISSTITLTSALQKARDAESDMELLARLLQRIQNPQRGGTAADYRFWAENSFNVLTGAALDIFRAYTYPLRDGLGTVDECATLNGSGTARAPSAALIAALQAYLNFVRPVTAVVTAYPPEMAAGRALRLRVRAQPSTAKNGTYAYDWDDFATLTAITGHTANSVTVAAIPPNLTAAFAAGKKPRIQVIISTSGASALPFVARVIGIAGTTLTLERSFTVQPTDAVDYFWAGSPIVDSIAQRVLDYVDQLGPSRASGTADPDDAWEDTLRLERVIDVVMETRDTDGTRMVLSMQPYATCVQTAIGAGAFNPVDRQPRDIRVGVGPELLFLRPGGIEVIK